jgi:hypothetical protein
MKRILAVLLACLLLCGVLSFAAGAAGDVSFKSSYYKVRYLSTKQLTWNGAPARFECEENALGISVDDKGVVKSEFCLRKWGFVQVRAYDGDGNFDTCTVEVDGDMWQWMIIIFLAGWFWY